MRLFLTFLRLGLTSFGGPVAHLAYFRRVFVEERRWLTEQRYAELLALCQFLPGPSSSQVGIAIGLMRAGWRGALAAWLGFTLPSAVLMILFAIGLQRWHGMATASLLHGLKLAAVAVIAQAVWGMAPRLCPDWPRRLLAAAAMALVLLAPAAWGQVAVIAFGAAVGASLLRGDDDALHGPLHGVLNTRQATATIAVFAFLLVALPVVATAYPALPVQMASAFYRTGSLVFGGGHVVLPLLQADVVPPGWVTQTDFLAGYGAAQALPGPLFSFAAFLGASANTGLGPWLGGALAVTAIFAPSFFLVAGALPFWARLRQNARSRAALAGVNASVVGLLLAVLYQPAATSAIHGWPDAVVAGLAFIALQFGRVPPWCLVALCAVLGRWI